MSIIWLGEREHVIWNSCEKRGNILVKDSVEVPVVYKHITIALDDWNVNILYTNSCLLNRSCGSYWRSWSSFVN